MWKSIRDHSLSLSIMGIWFGLTFAGYVSGSKDLQDYIYGLAHDAFGALVIVVCTKYFIEKGSPESKE